MKTPRFNRQIENFICDKCSNAIEGNGYTNHCPFCLYSKHVDINPGDRLAECQAMMEPIRLILKGGQPVSILHRCEKCGFERPNKISENDSREALFEIQNME